MPTYCYKCEACSESFEKILKIAEMDEPLGAECPECSVVGHVIRQIGLGQTLAFMTPESLGRKKAPEDFRNWLSAVKRANPKGDIRDH